jgi:hypothetical protein
METYSNPNQPSGHGYGSFQQQLPNATAVLVLGIISLVLCGIIGLICGIIALNMAGKAKALYESNPGMYTEASYSNVSSGRTCALIGVILSSIVVVFMIFYLIFIFALASRSFDSGW